jgi:hypothetical protein
MTQCRVRVAPLFLTLQTIIKSSLKSAVKNKKHMTKKLVWRLSKLPTVDEIHQLTTGADPVLTKEEAREILFSNEEVEERDKKSLEEEIKFLRALVESITKNNTKTIVETIKYIEKPYYNYGWFQPYTVWCSGTTSYGTAGTMTSIGSSTTTNLSGTSGNVNAFYTSAGTSNSLATGNNLATGSNFSKIKTF